MDGAAPFHHAFKEGMMVKDLVCKMEIDEKAAAYSLNYEGEDYFFCSEGCLEEFKRHPRDYVNPITQAEQG